MKIVLRDNVSENVSYIIREDCISQSFIFSKVSTLVETTVPLRLSPDAPRPP